jgi:hypothetical protein
MKTPGSRHEARGAIAVAVLLLASACGEIPQDAPKPYAGKEDTKAYAGDLFKGDKDKYEKALALRAQSQNEYVRNQVRNAPPAEAAKTK